MVLLQCTRETKWLGPGRWLRCTAHLGQCIHQAPGLLSCSDLARVQSACPAKFVLLHNTRESEQLKPGKCTKHRVHFGQCPCRGPWSLSRVDPRKYMPPWAGANPVWSIHCEHSPHMPVVSVCSVPPSPQHNWTNGPKEVITFASCVRLEFRHWTYLQTEEAKINKEGAALEVTGATDENAVVDID